MSSALTPELAAHMRRVRQRNERKRAEFLRALGAMKQVERAGAFAKRRPEPKP